MNDRISRHDMLIDVAQVVSRRSTCERNHVGVIVAIEGRPLVSGYNGAPTGMPHCDHTCVCLGDNMFSVIRGLEHDPGCPRVMPCTVSVHAEANAVAFAAKHGVRLEGSTLVTTLEPCLSCSMLIINSGIVEVVYTAQYRDHAGIQLLLNAGIKACYRPR